MSDTLVLPSDYQTEVLIISSMMRRRDALTTGSLELIPEDFQDLKNRAVFRALRALHEVDAYRDYESILTELEPKEREFITIQDIYDLANTISSGHDFAYKIPELKNLSGLRQLVMMSRDCMFRSLDKQMDCTEIAIDLLKNIGSIKLHNVIPNRKVNDIADSFHGKTYEEVLQWRLAQRAKNKPAFVGVSSGYDRLDQMLGFFRPGSIYLVGARTSMGKTTFILNLMLNMLKDTTIGFFSLEMPGEQIVEKIIAMMARVSHTKLEDGEFDSEEYERILEASKEIRKKALYVCDPNSMDINQIRMEAARMVHTQKCGILFVDYLTRVRTSSKFFNKHLEIDHISKAFQSLAKELNVPIVILAQLNRAAAGSEKPGLTSFRESGSIEEDADACLMLHRPEYYDPNSKPGILELIIAKNRIRGKIGTIEYSWQPGGTYREEMTLEEARMKINEIPDEDDNFNAFTPGRP